MVIYRGVVRWVYIWHGHGWLLSIMGFSGRNIQQQVAAMCVDQYAAIIENGFLCIIVCENILFGLHKTYICCSYKHYTLVISCQIIYIQHVQVDNFN